MMFDKFKATYGFSDFMLNGYLNNVINYATKDTAMLRGNFDLQSKHVSIDEFMAFADTPTKPAANTTASKGVVVLPKNLGVTFTANIDNATYQGVNIDSIKGQITLDSGKLKMIQSGFMIVGARAVMDATYVSLTPSKALFDYHITAKDFDIKKAYDGIALFRQMATSAKSVQGIVSLDYQLSGKLDENMHPLLPSIKGSGTLSLQKVKLKGFKLMNEVSKSTEKDGLTNPDLQKVDIKSTIANNIMTIERTKMKVAGFRPRFEGQVSLDGKYNLKGRVGLPPLGIFGIPFSVTGTQAKPIVKLKRGSDADSLKTTEEKD
jgi:AsmA protein